MSLLFLLLACSDPTLSGDTSDTSQPEEQPLWLGPLMLLVHEGDTLTATWTPPNPGPVHISTIPAGAQWDAHTATLSFTPDFTQASRSHLSLTDAAGELLDHISLTVVDAIPTPAPTIVSSEQSDGIERIELQQHTNEFLAGPDAGRDYPAQVVVPTHASFASPLPVRVWLHDEQHTPPAVAASADAFLVLPSDPDNTYWWGSAPNTSGPVPPFTQRRILALLEWVLKTYPGADPRRVYIEGEGMGGSGALLASLLHSRHFAYTDARFAQTIAHHHSPSRLVALSEHWGLPSEQRDDGSGTLDVWTRQDLTRALADEPQAQHAFVFLKHSKDDATVHFGAVRQPSALTHHSFYSALQASRIGHVAVWDEGGHRTPDPVLGADWWQAPFHPIFDDVTFLRTDLAFPAFSHSSADDNPGDGSGIEPWSDESGYAGLVSVPGDTRWSGALAGVINRGLRWDARQIVDTPTRFAMPLRVVANAGPQSPAGYPPRYDQLGSQPPVIVDVTPRRVQHFSPSQGTTVLWTFGTQSGSAEVEPDGSITIPALALQTDWTTLELLAP